MARAYTPIPYKANNREELIDTYHLELLNKKTNIMNKEEPKVTRIIIKIEEDYHYECEGIIQTKAGIRRVMKDNPIIKRLIEGKTAY